MALKRWGCKGEVRRGCGGHAEVFELEKSAEMKKAEAKIHADEAKRLRAEADEKSTAAERARREQREKDMTAGKRGGKEPSSPRDAHRTTHRQVPGSSAHGKRVKKEHEVESAAQRAEMRKKKK